jgi:hypothetical protein
MTRLKLRLHAGFISQLSATGWFKTLETHTTHIRMLVCRFYTYIFVWFTLKGSTDKTEPKAKASHAEKVLQASALSSFMARRFVTQQLDMESVCVYFSRKRETQKIAFSLRFFLMNQLGVNINCGDVTIWASCARKKCEISRFAEHGVLFHWKQAPWTSRAGKFHKNYIILYQCVCSKGSQSATCDSPQSKRRIHINWERKSTLRLRCRTKINRKSTVNDVKSEQ